MTPSSTPTILLIGLKGSGKTTFLAALWHLLEAQEVPAALRTPFLQPDREHLNALRRRWLELRLMERTGLQESRTVTVNVEECDSRRSASVVFPDISGEVFRMQWEDREVLRDYLELERNARGAVLFVHPHGVKPSPRIPMVVENGHNDGQGHEATASNTRPREVDRPKGDLWHPKQASTQVQLVDVLQQYLSFAESRPLRLALVVSAWDLVEAVEINPETWIEARLPLLSQFVLARRGEIETRYFGVSAQGGDLERDRNELAKHLRPSERPFVVEEGKRHSDLTTVVRWTLP